MTAPHEPRGRPAPRSGTATHTGIVTEECAGPQRNLPAAARPPACTPATTPRPLWRLPHEPRSPRWCPPRPPAAAVHVPEQPAGAEEPVPGLGDAGVGPHGETLLLRRRSPLPGGMRSWGTVSAGWRAPARGRTSRGPP